MMTFESDAAGVIEFTVDGEVTRAEYDAAAVAMDKAILRHGKLRAVAVVRDFAGMEMAAWWKDIGWGATHLTKIERVAVVTDIAWIGVAVKGVGWMMPGEQKLFGLGELAAARACVRE